MSGFSISIRIEDGLYKKSSDDSRGPLHYDHGLMYCIGMYIGMQQVGYMQKLDSDDLRKAVVTELNKLGVSYSDIASAEAECRKENRGQFYKDVIYKKVLAKVAKNVFLA